MERENPKKVRVGERKMENLCYDTKEKVPLMEFPRG